MLRINMDIISQELKIDAKTNHVEYKGSRRGNQLILVKKSNGRWWMCVDF